MIATALLPSIGYDKATELVSRFLASGRLNIVEFLRAELGDAMVSKVFSARSLVALGYKDGQA